MRKRGNEMKKIDIMRLEGDRGGMAGAWAYIFYGDAKASDIRRGDQFVITTNGEVLDDSTYEAVEYITFRGDIQRGFRGFRCQKVI